MWGKRGVRSFAVSLYVGNTYLGRYTPENIGNQSPGH